MEDYAQYGLTEPICTISITAGEETYTVQLGDFSKMDEQRYVSIGDGKAYLVSHDPVDEFGAVLRDMIRGEYARHPRVIRLEVSADGGTTDLVLREL
mgnify:CR=1 FL=1